MSADAEISQETNSNNQPMPHCRLCLGESRRNKPLFTCSKCTRRYHSACHRPFPSVSLSWICITCQSESKRVRQDQQRHRYHENTSVSSPTTSTSRASVSLFSSMDRSEDSYSVVNSAQSGDVSTRHESPTCAGLNCSQAPIDGHPLCKDHFDQQMRDLEAGSVESRASKRKLEDGQGPSKESTESAQRLRSKAALVGRTTARKSGHRSIPGHGLKQQGKYSPAHSQSSLGDGNSIQSLSSRPSAVSGQLVKSNLGGRDVSQDEGPRKKQKLSHQTSEDGIGLKTTMVTKLIHGQQLSSHGRRPDQSTCRDDGCSSRLDEGQCNTTSRPGPRSPPLPPVRTLGTASSSSRGSSSTSLPPAGYFSTTGSRTPSITKPAATEQSRSKGEGDKNSEARAKARAEADAAPAEGLRDISSNSRDHQRSLLKHSSVASSHEKRAFPDLNGRLRDSPELTSILKRHGSGTRRESAPAGATVEPSKELQRRKSGSLRHESGTSGTWRKYVPAEAAVEQASAPADDEVPHVPKEQQQGAAEKPRRKPVNEKEFDAMIYAQEGALPPPAGLELDVPARKPKPSGPPREAAYGYIDPRLHWPQDRSEKWREDKLKEIEARGGRKARFGKAAESLRKVEQAESERMKELGLKWEDTLPDRIRNNPSWVAALKRFEGIKDEDDGSAGPGQASKRAKGKGLAQKK